MEITVDIKEHSAGTTPRKWNGGQALSMGGDLKKKKKKKEEKKRDLKSSVSDLGACTYTTHTHVVDALH